MKFQHDLIIRPVLTEKSYDLMAERKYTFEVDKNADKPDIRYAVEKIFGVKVAQVNTFYRKGQLKRQGRTQGYRPDRKFAIVKLSPESKGIEFFEGMAQQ
jgi:large subunit ribosomal protein L23